MNSTPIPAAAAAARIVHRTTGVVSPVAGPFWFVEPELPEAELVPELAADEFLVVDDAESEDFCATVNRAEALPSSKTAAMVWFPAARVSRKAGLRETFRLPEAAV